METSGWEEWDGEGWPGAKERHALAAGTVAYLVLSGFWQVDI